MGFTASSEELNAEMANLDGLMKDLNALSTNEPLPPPQYQFWNMFPVAEVSLQTTGNHFRSSLKCSCLV